MDAVFSLQRATDAVFSYQFPVSADEGNNLHGPTRKRRRISPLVGEQIEMEEIAAMLSQLFTEGIFNG